jgi:phage repressor protein C with HTH and peptisase S24 domain
MMFQQQFGHLHIPKDIEFMSLHNWVRNERTKTRDYKKMFEKYGDSMEHSYKDYYKLMICTGVVT